MSKVAFELRADASDFSGGTVSLVDGEAFDVAEALDAGKGKIVLNPTPAERKSDDAQAEENERATRDGQIVSALDAFPVLKRVAASASGGSSTTSEGGKD